MHSLALGLELLDPLEESRVDLGVGTGFVAEEFNDSAEELVVAAVLGLGDRCAGLGAKGG